MKIYNKIFIGLNLFLVVICLGLAVVRFNYPKFFSANSLMIFSDKANSQLKIMATGDIMLGRHVETLMNRHGEMYPFTFFSDFNLDQDVIIGNLEGPIPETHTKTADFTTNFSFKKSTAPLLHKVGFTHITLANNHTVDKGEQNFWHTKKILEESKLTVFGNPRSTDKNFVKLQEINGTEVGFIGLNEAVSSYFDAKAAIQLIDELERINPDRFLIVNIHWGTEYQNTSNKKQKELARSFVNAGADLIIGHHPHVVQEIEVYKNKLIFYSLGNFIFDQYFSKETQEGMVVYFDLKPKTITSKIQGIDIDKSRPKPMADQSVFLEGLAQRSSKELETQIKSGTITLNN